jgi:hypothetical protein
VMRPMITMGPVSSGCGSGAGTLDQPGNGVGQLRTLALPVAYTFQLKTQRLLAFSDRRIVEANTLDETAIAAIARIRDHHIVKRTIPGTATGKTNDYHIKIYLKFMSPAPML